MKRNIVTLLVLLVFYGCSQSQSHKPYQPANLTKVSEEQLILQAKNHESPDLENIVFKNSKGEVISKESLMELVMDLSYVPDFYQNADGKTVEAVIRKTTEKDEQLRQKMQAAFEEGPDVKAVEINCEDKKKMLSEIYERDQGMRRPGGTFDPKADHQNLEVIISFIEKCGIPTLEEVDENEMAAVWLVLQHAPPRYQSKYIPLLEEAAERGDLTWEPIALMKDRALMHQGKPQLYGSQVSDDALYDLFEPEYVDQRRAAMEMEPLEDYLKHFGIAFDIEQKTK